MNIQHKPKVYEERAQEHCKKASKYIDSFFKSNALYAIVYALLDIAQAIRGLQREAEDE